MINTVKSTYVYILIFHENFDFNAHTSFFSSEVSPSLAAVSKCSSSFSWRLLSAAEQGQNQNTISGYQNYQLTKFQKITS